MFKRFMDSKVIVNELELDSKYPNKAYIVINTKQDPAIPGTVCGELYALADRTPEDMQAYSKEINELHRQGIQTLVGNNFDCEVAIEE